MKTNSSKMTIHTLAGALPDEMTRVRDEVLPVYLEIGDAGTFAAAIIRRSLDDATKALAEGDIIGMFRAYNALRGFHT